MKLFVKIVGLYLSIVLIVSSQPIFCISNTWTVPEAFAGADVSPSGVQVRMDGQGNAYAVWATPSSGEIKISKFFTDTQSWGVIKTLGGGSIPWISVDSVGNAIIGWNGQVFPSSIEIKATYYNVNQSWEEWAPFVKTITDSASFGFGLGGGVAISDNGTAIIEWIDASSFELRATLFDNSQDWVTWNPNDFLKVNFPSGYIQDRPIVAMGGEGSAIFTLFHLVGGQLFLYATRYDGLTDWSAWDPSSTLKQISNSRAFNESLVMNAQGNAAFVWLGGFPSGNSIASFFDKTETWDLWNPVLKIISSEIIQNITFAMNDNNNIVFVWSRSLNLKASRYDGSEWSSWTPPSPIIIFASSPFAGFLALAKKSVGIDNNGNASVIYNVSKGTKSNIQSVVFDVQENVWKEPVDISDPFANLTSLGVPDCAQWKQNPDINTIGAMAVWPILSGDAMFAQTLTPPPLNLLDVQPGVNTAVSSGSDSSGNIHIGVLGQGTASLLSHKPEDPISVWSSRQVSDPNHNVDQLALGVNVDNNIAVAYINNASNQGQAWVVRNENSPELISTATENARDIAVAISNNVQVAEVHVNTTVSEKLKNGLEDLYAPNYPGGQFMKSGENLGEISVTLFDPITEQWVNKIVSPGPSALPQIATSALGNIYVTWILNDGVNSKIQAAYAPYNSLINQWVWQNNLDISITGSVDQLRVVVDSLDINTIFAWKEWDGSNWRINSAWYDGYTNWNTWAHTTTYLSPAGFDADNLSIFMDSAGNAPVVWQFFDGVDTQIQAARFDSQTKQWTLPSITKGIPQTISPVGATRPNVSLAKQGDGIVSYNVGRQTYYNLWNFDSQTFGPATNTDFPPGLLASSLCVANWNGTVRGVINTVGIATRQNNDEKIWVTLPKGPADVKPAAPIAGRSMQELHRFPLQADLVNVIRWQAGDNTAVRYEIYADSVRTQLLGIIPADCPLVFCDHCRQPGILTTYYLFAVNAAGKYSDPSEIVVP